MTASSRDIIQNIIQPKLTNNVVVPGMEKLNSLFGSNTDFRSGKRITDANCLTVSSTGGAFTEADANPDSITQTWANPYWNKVYYHDAFEVRREEIDEATEGPLTQLLQDGLTKATKQMMSAVQSGCMTQIKSDVDSAGNYSNGAITRSTPLQSYEESTDATITEAYMRAAQNALSLKGELDWNQYVWLMNQNVFNVFKPLANATRSFSETNNRNSPITTGYVIPRTYDEIGVESMFGMTVGDLYLLNRDDVQIQTHKTFEVEEVPTNAYSRKFVTRIGVNAWVRRPKFQAKLTNKD